MKEIDPLPEAPRRVLAALDTAARDGQSVAPVVHPPATQATDVDRILDAAANRCREGLRVVEDYARFTLGDAYLSERLKVIRHELTLLLVQLGSDQWMRARDTQGDVGAAIHTETESQRPSLSSVLRANCKRVQESLRTLEEFGKLSQPATAGQIGELRYRFYTIEQAVAATADARRRIADARLYLLVTERQCSRGVGPVVREALRGGVDLVQLREKERTDRQLIDLAKRIREWTRAAGALFIVNDRPDLAAIVDADGVHLGQDDMPVPAARRIVGGSRLIGVSTHVIEQAREAVLAGADYLGVGPTFPSPTKSFEQLAGLAYVRQVAEEITLPWFAIGGIYAGNFMQVLDAGASRLAVSSAVCGAASPAEAARTLLASGATSVPR